MLRYIVFREGRGDRGATGVAVVRATEGAHEGEVQGAVYTASQMVLGNHALQRQAVLQLLAEPGLLVHHELPSYPPPALRVASLQE